MSVSGRVRTLVAAALTCAVGLTAPGQISAQEPEFYDRPYAPGQWTYGRRLDESQLRYCVDRRDPDWEVAAEIADAIALGLLLEPQRHVVESQVLQEDLTKVYQVMLEHCDMHMGFKLIPEGYPPWAALSRSYYRTRYVFVTTQEELQSLADQPPGRPIGATIGTAAHLHLLSYNWALPADKRWPVFPMGSNEVALDVLHSGTVNVALVWAPSLWNRQRRDPDFAGVRVMDPSPVPPTELGVGALLLSDETFLRAAIDEAIAALSADGTIDAILKAHDFPATVQP